MNKFVPSAMLPEILNQETAPARLVVAHKIVDGAQRTVDDDTGNYARKTHTFTDRRGIGAQTDDIAGHIIEWGSTHQSPQAPIRTGSDAAGRFVPR